MLELTDAAVPIPADHPGSSCRTTWQVALPFPASPILSEHSVHVGNSFGDFTSCPGIRIRFIPRAYASETDDL